MKVVITGGFGYLGQQLCRRILALGELVGSDEQKAPVAEVVLFDLAAPAAVDLLADARVRAVTGNITDAATCASLVDQDGMIVFHLASVMSGQGEADFDLCFRVNMEGTRNLMEACRARRGSKFIFASSGACFGERQSGPETDTTKLLPYTTYGMTKAVCELLINDYSRRGFLDGRCARLPTVIPRPEVNSGLPAAFSAVIREPLKGQDATLNVAPDMRHAVCGFRPLVRNLVHLAEIPAVALSGSSDRTVNMPCISVTCQMLYDALRSVVLDPSKLGIITFKPDPVVVEKLSTFHSNMDATRAFSLGMVSDASAAAIAADFAAEYVDPALLKPVLEIDEEPRHQLVLSNSSVRVFRADFPVGDCTLMHSHRVDSLYFFLTTLRTQVQKDSQPLSEDSVSFGEVRYGDHCICPLVHKIKVLGPQPMLCVDVELLDYARAAQKAAAAGETAPPAKRARAGACAADLCDGLTLTKERPGARVYTLRVPAESSWKGTLPFSRILFVVQRGARVQGDLGDRLLQPADTFFKDGPLDLSIQVLGSRELVLWVTELLP